MAILGAILNTGLVGEIESGAGVPGSAPGAIGNIFVDTTNDNVYLAADTAAAGDWKQATGAGGGNVSNTGTPLNDQLAVWTDATTIEGTTGLTYDGSILDVTGSLGLSANVLDANGNELVGFVTDASAANFIEIENEAATSGPIIRATGSDANVNMEFATKGTGAFNFTGDITLTGTVDGVDVGALATGLDYTVTNPNIDRAIDLNGFTLDELGDVVGTLIGDLITAGIII